MAYRTPQPSIDAAAKGDPNQQALFRDLHRRILDLEAKSGMQGFDSDKQSPIAAAPVVASFTPDTTGGGITVNVVNPQYKVITKANSGKDRNQLGATIHHRLEYSTNADFSDNVVRLPPSSQTSFKIDPPSGTYYVRVSSSYNGKTFNKPIIKGPLTVTGGSGGGVGPQGPAGPAGATGATGATGPQGPAGAVVEVDALAIDGGTSSTAAVAYVFDLDLGASA